MMKKMEDIRASIDSLLDDLWDNGNEIGKADQLNEDEIKKEEETTRAYDEGYNECYKQGLEDGKKEVSK